MVEHLRWLPVLLSLSACGAPNGNPVDVAHMPTDANGVQVMSDQGAISLAAYDLSEPSRTRGDLVQGAMALAAIDYLAGRIDNSPNWVCLPLATKAMILRGRGEVRETLAVAPGTSSQAVVDGLVAASRGGDPRAALPASVFTRGPDATVALISNLPYLPLSTAAIQAIDQQSRNCAFYGACGHDL